MVKNMKLYEKIYNDIKDQILAGAFSGNALLPTEKMLQDKYSVSRITVKHAYQLLEEQGFVERIAGKGTILKRSNQKTNKQIIGVVLCDFDFSFGVQLIKSIESTAKEQGYRILLARSFDSHENESRVLADFVSLGVSGIIIQNCHGEFTKNLVELFIREFPVVSVDRYAKGLLIPYVTSDNYGGSVAAAEYLFERGHKSILFASSNPNSTSTLTERILGFQQAFMQHNIPINAKLMITDLTSPIVKTEKQVKNDIDKILNALKETNCSAIVASERFVAELCTSAIENLNSATSRKIELVCFDYPDRISKKNVCAYIQQNDAELGRRAVLQLCSIINGEKAEMRSIIPSKLIIKK